MGKARDIKVVVAASIDNIIYDEVRRMASDPRAEVWFDGIWKIKSFDEKTGVLNVVCDKHSTVHIGFEDFEPIPNASNDTEK